MGEEVASRLLYISSELAVVGFDGVELPMLARTAVEHIQTRHKKSTGTAITMGTGLPQR